MKGILKCEQLRSTFFHASYAEFLSRTEDKKTDYYAAVNGDRANFYKDCDENDNSENVMYSPLGKILAFSFDNERVFEWGNVKRKEGDRLKGAQKYWQACGYINRGYCLFLYASVTIRQCGGIIIIIIRKEFSRILKYKWITQSWS